MSALSLPASFGPVSKHFVNQPIEDELSAGVSGGYGIISYRGKVWRTKYRGEERDLMRADGDGPRASIEVVILKASINKSKIFYKDGYKDGSSESPDCFSANGVTPDISSKAKQANTCDACPMNAWGSKITAAGKPTKACSDSKRVAVVPIEDLENEAFGGPMLLRIPAASLQDAATFSQRMKTFGYPLHSIAVRISFDTKEAFPKFVFKEIRPLEDHEVEMVLALRDDARTARVLSETVEAEAPMIEQAPAFEQASTGTARSTGNGGASFAPPPRTSAAPVQRLDPPRPVVPAHDPETGEIAEAAPVTQKRDYKKKPAPAPAPAPVASSGSSGSYSSFSGSLPVRGMW
jgi:hypothetical protein